MVTPLGLTASDTWDRLIRGESGIRSVSAPDLASSWLPMNEAEALLPQLPSRVAGIVPDAGNSEEGSSDADAAPSGNSLSPGRGGNDVPRFVSHALRAAEEALKDARWRPEEDEDQRRTVSESASGRVSE